MSSDNLHQRKDTSSSRASMREKLVDKRKAQEEHESNFAAGRVNVHERHLHRTGIRGRKIWIFLAILYILALVCIINLMILCIMYGVLKINKDGMDSLSFFDSGMLRWMQTSDLETVTLYKHNIGGFSGQTLNIESKEKKVILHGGPTTVSPQIHISDGDTVIQAKKGFGFVDPYAKKEILRFDGDTLSLSAHVYKGHEVVINRVITHRVVSNENETLHLESNKTIDVRGNEGISMDGKVLTFEANGDINITSLLKKQVIFDAPQIFFKTSNKSLPAIPQQYKLCACRSGHKLYTVIQNIPDASCRTVKNICL